MAHGRHTALLVLRNHSKGEVMNWNAVRVARDLYDELDQAEAFAHGVTFEMFDRMFQARLRIARVRGGTYGPLTTQQVRKVS